MSNLLIIHALVFGRRNATQAQFLYMHAFTACAIVVGMVAAEQLAPFIMLTLAMLSFIYLVNAATTEMVEILVQQHSKENKQT